MNDIVQCLMLVLFMLLVPIIIGLGMTNYEKICKYDKLIVAYVFGNLIMMALFQVIAVPMILCRAKFSCLLYIWIVLIFSAVFCSVFHGKRAGKRKGFEGRILFDGLDKEKMVVYTLAFLLIVIQIGFYLNCHHVDEDDSRFIVNALEAYQHNTMYTTNPCTGEATETFLSGLINDVVSPWSMYIAAIAKICGIHPTIFAHMALPVFVLLLTYAVIYCIGAELSVDEKDIRPYILLFAGLVNIFGYCARHFTSAFTLIRNWQGKAVVASVFLPALLLMFIKIYKETEWQKLLPGLLIVNLGMCLASGMGIIVGLVCNAAYAFVYFLLSKNFKRLLCMLLMCLPNVFYFILNYKILK